MTDKYAASLGALHKALSNPMRTTAELPAVGWPSKLTWDHLSDWCGTCNCTWSISSSCIHQAGAEAGHSLLFPASHLADFPPSPYPGPSLQWALLVADYDTADTAAHCLTGLSSISWMFMVFLLLIVLSLWPGRAKRLGREGNKRVLFVWPLTSAFFVPCLWGILWVYRHCN